MTSKDLKIQIKEKPKICAIDLHQEIIDVLRARGLECFSGTLGAEVRVPNIQEHNRYPCLPNCSFPPNLHEYDIVIIDLKAQDPIAYDPSEHKYHSFKGNEQPIFLSIYPETIFDPRPFSANILNRALQDFLKKETLIILLSTSQEVVEYHHTVLTSTGYDYRTQKSVEHSLYDLLPCIQEIRNKNGRNIVTSNFFEVLKLESLKNIFLRYKNNLTYEAVFEHPQEWRQGENKYCRRNSFIPLLFNTDNEIISFIDFIYSPSKILVIPQLVEQKKEFLVELIDEVLPGIFPKLFPYNDQFSWLKSENYLLPNQANLLEEKGVIINKYQQALEQIDERIQQNQITHQFLHDLLSETGDSLVKSVEQFFSWLGFTHIINMDETNPTLKEEDLQIHLSDGLLVVEIKGIGGTSKDEECSQINKIKYRRAKERGRFDVSALYVVNHQRYLPPHERKNPPFTEQQIADAQAEERGLLTTYELFKLYSHIENGFITKEDARNALMQYGLVQFKPSLAHCIGISPLDVHYQGIVVILTIGDIRIPKGTTVIVCNDGNWCSAEIVEIRDDGKIVEYAYNGEFGFKFNRTILKTSEIWLQEIQAQAMK
jgi:hypothetical protein